MGMKQQIRIFLMMAKSNYDLANCQSQNKNKTSQTCRLCNINAANCIVLLLTRYTVICALFAQYTQPKQATTLCQQKIRVDIEVEYFCDIIIFITIRHQYYTVLFCKYNARNLVWNWYGKLSSIPFHSGIFHIPY